MGFDPLKDIWYDIGAIRKRALNKIIILTQNKVKTSFNAWHQNVTHTRHIEACKATIEVFNSLSDGLSNQLQFVLESDHDAQKKIAVIKQILQFRKVKLMQGFERWRKYRDDQRYETMVDTEKKKFSADRLANLLERAQEYTLKDAYETIRQRVHAIKLQRKFILGLYKTRVG